MAYRIEYTSRGARTLRRIRPPLRDRVVARIDQLAPEPRPDGCEKLTDAGELYTVRVNRNYRIFYRVDDTAQTVTIDLVGPHDFYGKV